MKTKLPVCEHASSNGQRLLRSNTSRTNT